VYLTSTEAELLRDQAFMAGVVLSEVGSTQKKGNAPAISALDVSSVNPSSSSSSGPPPVRPELGRPHDNKLIQQATQKDAPLEVTVVAEQKVNNEVSAVQCNEKEKGLECILRFSRKLPENMTDNKKNAKLRAWDKEISLATHLGEIQLAPPVVEAAIYEDRLVMLIKKHGSSLANYMSQMKDASVPEYFGNVCEEICKLIEIVARCGVFLADMKPENIVIDVKRKSDDRVKVIDFESFVVSLSRYDRGISGLYPWGSRYIRALYGASMSLLLRSHIQKFGQYNEHLKYILIDYLNLKLKSYSLYLPPCDPPIDKVITDSQYYKSLEPILKAYKYFGEDSENKEINFQRFWKKLKEGITYQNIESAPSIDKNENFRIWGVPESVSPPDGLTKFTKLQLQKMMGANERNARR
jgi:hypothetical protein